MNFLTRYKKSEADLGGKLWNFWQLIKVYPAKWMQHRFGEKGGGFWVVAICGTKIIWYNDIEEGFNISGYKTLGQIEGYYCDQDELGCVVRRLFNLIKPGEGTIEQVGPENLMP